MKLKNFTVTLMSDKLDGIQNGGGEAERRLLISQAYRRLGHHHSTVAAVLNGLLASPRGVAELLHATDAATAANAVSSAL